MTTALGLSPETRHLMLQNSVTRGEVHQPDVSDHTFTSGRVELTLHSNVGTETGLGDDVSGSAGIVSLFSTGELESDPVGNDGRVSVGNVGKGTGVNEDGGSLQGLHEGGFDGVLHEDGHGTGTTDVVGGDGIARPARPDDHLSEPAIRVVGSVTGGRAGTLYVLQRRGKTHLSLRSARSVARARTAMTSDPTAISNAVSRVIPASVGA